MSGSKFCAMTHVPRMFEKGTLYAPLNRMLVQSGFQYEITCTANEGHMDLFLKLLKAVIKKGAGCITHQFKMNFLVWPNILFSLSIHKFYSLKALITLEQVNTLVTGREFCYPILD